MYNKPELGFAHAAEHMAGNAIGGAISGTAQNLHSAIVDTSRPFGVTMLASWSAIQGTLYGTFLLLSLCGLNFLSLLFPPAVAPSQPVNGGMGGQYNPYATSPALAGTNITSSLSIGTFLLFLLILTALAAAHIAFARGLLLMQRWAYWATIALEGVTIFAAIIIASMNHNSLWLISTIFLPALTLLYMFALPSVRKSFVRGWAAIMSLLSGMIAGLQFTFGWFRLLVDHLDHFQIARRLF